MDFSHKYKKKYNMYYKDDKLVSELLSFFRNNDRKTYLLSEVAEIRNSS